MLSSHSPRVFAACFAFAVLTLSTGLIPSAVAEEQNEDTSLVSVTIEVKEYDTGTPISQARLTLQFSEPGTKARFGKPKTIAFNAKTNAQGRYRFTNINKGTIHLIVTADRHQSFGKEYELERDGQVIEVKLKRPQPLL